MNIEHVEKSYQELESDSTLQNLIAQANARYILYNTEESKENFPRYTIKDEQLNILAFKYLNIGCNYFSEHNYLKAVLRHWGGEPRGYFDGFPLLLS